MRRITLILPVYNDWESLKLLLGKVEKILKKRDYEFQVLIVNDNSSKINKKTLNQNKFFKSIKSINLKVNIGSQKAIATGIKYIAKNPQKFGKDFIIMDSDGEDDYTKINKILDYTKKNKKISVVTVNRSSRKDSLIFKFLYEIHLILTFFLTFKYIRYGNYSYLNYRALKFISNKKELWLAYSASIEKNFQNKKSIIAARKKRFMGRSKMNYLQLFSHSVKIHLVFINTIFINYLFYSLFFTTISKFEIFNFTASLFFIFLFIHLLSLITIGILSSKIRFYESLSNIKSIDLLK